MYRCGRGADREPAIAAFSMGRNSPRVVAAVVPSGTARAREFRSSAKFGLSAFGPGETRGCELQLSTAEQRARVREDSCMQTSPAQLIVAALGRGAVGLRGLQATCAATRCRLRRHHEGGGSRRPCAGRSAQHPQCATVSFLAAARNDEERAAKKMNGPLPSRPGHRALPLRGGARRICRQGGCNRSSGRRIPRSSGSRRIESHDLVVAARARPAYNI
jgi:hypothetical protein